MSKSLPVNSSLEHIKKEAKSILKEHKQKNIVCCSILKNLFEFKDKTDSAILSSKISLQKVQLALAVEYGFKNWEDLKNNVANAESHTVNIKDLAMPPFCTSIMGTMRGIANHFNIKISDQMLYGLSGHVFLINIHNQICPSGPYIWNPESFNKLLENIGIKTIKFGFFGRDTTSEERSKVEKLVCEALDKGQPCSLMNMEGQIISGYDNEGLNILRPWGDDCPGDITPSKLTFGSWKEFGNNLHTCFFTYKKLSSKDLKISILDSIDYAVELFTNPRNFSREDYGIGYEAYDNWINAVSEFGSTHGNWWNATVWSECRSMAALYVEEIGKNYNNISEITSKLKKQYLEISEKLKQVGNTELNPENKIEILKLLKVKEKEAIKNIKILRSELSVVEFC